MDQAVPGMLLREAFMVLGTVGGPMFAVLLAAGLVVGVLQAATQIQDPAVGFLPRLLAALTVCWLLGSWMMTRLSGFLASALQRMAAH